MLEVTDAARSRLAGWHACWAHLERGDGSAGQLPDPATVVPEQDPDRLSEHPVAKAYRQAFWELDIDPTKQRPAGEALARRVARGKGIPEILPIVDAYNLASAATLVPISAFAEPSLEGDLTLDVSAAGEMFEPIGADPVKVRAGCPVWRDETSIVSLTAYRDGQRTALAPDVEQVLVVAVGPRAVGPRVIPEAMRRLEQYVRVAGWRFASSPETIAL